MIKDVNVTIDIQKVVGLPTLNFPYLIFAVDDEEAVVPYTEVTIDSEIENEKVKKFVDALKKEDNPPEKIAFRGLTITNNTGTGVVSALNDDIENGWRQLVCLDIGSADEMKNIMDYIESTDKLLYVPYTVLPSKTALGNKVYERTIVVKVDDGDDDNAKSHEIETIACILGATCGLQAGSFTYKNIIVNGGYVTSNKAYRTATATSGYIPFIAILEKAGDKVTSDGVTIGGDYIDIIDSKDYIVNQIEYQVQKVLNEQDKVPYTNTGISMLEAAALNVLKTAYNNGMIADNSDGSPAYSVSFGLREDAEAEDIQTRKYVEGTFEFVVSGAIHTVKINGTIKYV